MRRGRRQWRYMTRPSSYPFTPRTLGQGVVLRSHIPLLTDLAHHCMQPAIGHTSTPDPFPIHFCTFHSPHLPSPPFLPMMFPPTPPCFIATRQKSIRRRILLCRLPLPLPPPLLVAGL
eukprot:GGOE01032188.1.p1 GENE.GGOE01032188.1~~GGOE01032188.1.p1  ORF type:complete len:118 (-),score=1.46 GGOE01032188.1:99-452(-)